MIFKANFNIVRNSKLSKIDIIIIYIEGEKRYGLDGMEQ